MRAFGAPFFVLPRPGWLASRARDDSSPEVEPDAITVDLARPFEAAARHVKVRLLARNGEFLCSCYARPAGHFARGARTAVDWVAFRSARRVASSSSALASGASCDVGPAVAVARPGGLPGRYRSYDEPRPLGRIFGGHEHTSITYSRDRGGPRRTRWRRVQSRDLFVLVATDDSGARPSAHDSARSRRAV
jgi:hypothetical protein